MSLLIQFLLRLTFGLAVGMGITSSRLVTSGYFRNHLYVTLGLSSLAALICYSAMPEAFWYALLAAVFSYVGSICWLYEKSTPGKAMLLFVALSALTGTFFPLSTSADSREEQGHFSKTFPLPSADNIGSAAEVEQQALQIRGLGLSAEFLSHFANVSSGLLLGMTMAAMLLGHWYLNSPTMDLLPLRRLIIAMGLALLLQLMVSLWGLWGEFSNVEQLSTQWILFVLLRWTFGLLGVGAMTWMAWQTLKIPNTQSATGILYVAVIGTFVGETMALLLSSESLFPL